eukprot:432745-Pyramimonas_sp.AAC.3
MVQRMPNATRYKFGVKSNAVRVGWLVARSAIRIRRRFGFKSNKCVVVVVVVVAVVSFRLGLGRHGKRISPSNVIVTHHVPRRRLGSSALRRLGAAEHAPRDARHGRRRGHAAEAATPREARGRLKHKRLRATRRQLKAPCNCNVQCAHLCIN